MSHDAMWCHAIWGDVISCVVSCHVMQRDVMWRAFCDELSSVVKWCDAMGWDLMSLWCDGAGCEVTLCGSKWLCDVVNWKMMWWSVLQSTTKYYPVLQRATKCHKIPRSTNPYYKVLLRTTKCFTIVHNTTKYYSVLHSATNYYSVRQSTTQYYKVLLRIIPSTTKYFSLSTTP